MRPRSAASPPSRGAPQGRVPQALIALVVIVSSGTASAEPLGNHAELTQLGGYTVFSKHRHTLTNVDLKNALYLGGRLGYHFERWLGAEFAAGFTPAHEDVTNGVDLDFWHVSGNVVLRPFRAVWGSPYVSAGAGISRLKYSEGGGGDTQGNGEAGVGVQLWLNDAIGVRIDARDIMWTPKEDVGKIESNDDVVGAGRTFARGARPRDVDGDGVAERIDVCPDTPKGCRVDAKGCPLDADGDGVCDGLDQCPDTAKGCRVDAKGC